MEDLKLSKLNLNKDDILIMRFPTDEFGCPNVAYEELSNYYNSLKDKIPCKLITLPDNHAFEIMDTNTLKTYIKDLQSFIETENYVD